MNATPSKCLAIERSTPSSSRQDHGTSIVKSVDVIAKVVVGWAGMGDGRTGVVKQDGEGFSRGGPGGPGQNGHGAFSGGARDRRPWCVLRGAGDRTTRMRSQGAQAHPTADTDSPRPVSDAECCRLGYGSDTLARWTGEK